MSEENIEQVEEQVENPSEQQARAQGWVSSEEWVEQGKDESEWVDARTFNMRGEFFDKIHSQKREILELKSAVDDLKVLNSKVAEKTRQETIDQLKQAKVKALEEEDHETVVDIDEELANLRNEPEIETTSQPTVDPVEFKHDFDNWRTKNSWYDDDEDLRIYADAVGTRLAQQAGGAMGHQEIFVEVSKKVKETFPQKFQNQNRTKQTVSSTNRASKGTQNSKFSFDDLNEEQQKIAKRFDRLGVKSVDDYIADLVEIGEL